MDYLGFFKRRLNRQNHKHQGMQNGYYRRKEVREVML